MKLQRITSQSEDLRQFYSPSQAWGEPWQERISAMLALVAHLECEVDYPPQCVLTSHEDLFFTELDDYRRWLVSVHPCTHSGGSPAAAIYKIRHRTQQPWSYVVGYAADPQTAGEMIVQALDTPSV